MKIKAIAIVVLSFLIQGCATVAQKRELVLKRAVFDLDCSSERLNATELSADTYGITGCGKKATYLVSCPKGHGYNAHISECTAVLNSPKGAVVEQTND